MIRHSAWEQELFLRTQNNSNTLLIDSRPEPCMLTATMFSQPICLLVGIKIPELEENWVKKV